MLLWLDVETTGLDPSSHAVLEVGAILTDRQLNEVARFHRLVALPDAYVSITPKVRMMHTSNGLLAACEESGSQLDRVDEELAIWLDDHCEFPPPVCGSHPEFDRDWARFHLEEACRRFGRRNLDVNSLWLLLIGDGRKPERVYRAISDLERDLDLARVVRAALDGTGVDTLFSRMGGVA